MARSKSGRGGRAARWRRDRCGRWSLSPRPRPKNEATVTGCPTGMLRVQVLVPGTVDHYWYSAPRGKVLNSRSCPLLHARVLKLNNHRGGGAGARALHRLKMQWLSCLAIEAKFEAGLVGAEAPGLCRLTCPPSHLIKKPRVGSAHLSILPCLLFVKPYLSCRIASHRKSRSEPRRWRARPAAAVRAR